MTQVTWYFTELARNGSAQNREGGGWVGSGWILGDKSLTTIYLPYARIVGQCLSILVPIMGEWKIMEMYTNYSPFFSCSFGPLKSSSDISII
jgi:hypothetical protein